jgi:hypothetical protein
MDQPSAKRKRPVPGEGNTGVYPPPGTGSMTPAPLESVDGTLAKKPKEG